MVPDSRSNLFKRVVSWQTLKSKNVQNSDGRTFSIDETAEGEKFVDAADNVVEQPRVEAHGQGVDRLPALGDAVGLGNDVTPGRHPARCQRFNQIFSLNAK